MAKKVTTPARISVPTEEPRALMWKKRSSAPSDWRVVGAAAGTLPLLSVMSVGCLSVRTVRECHTPSRPTGQEEYCATDTMAPARTCEQPDFLQDRT